VLAAELYAEPDTKKRWQRRSNARDERLRFPVERYIWDREEGKPGRQQSPGPVAPRIEMGVQR